MKFPLPLRTAGDRKTRIGLPNYLALFWEGAEKPVTDGGLGRWYSPGIVKFEEGAKYEEIPPSGCS